MDLSTLSSLLETHTSTLQRLYTTLGAPSETVSQKLEELHSALISTVNAQRDAAEREVREVQDKVSTLRRSCESKRRRLGETRRTSEVQPQEGRLSSNAATARATDESLLEALSRLEEEDRSTDEIVARRQKLFSQALERLDTFVALLGADSVAIDFQFNNNDDGKGRQPTAATRADRMEDLSLARLEKLEEEARRCEKEVEQMQVTLRRLLQEVSGLWDDLGISPLERYDPSSSTHHVQGHPASLPSSTRVDRAEEEHRFDLQILVSLGIALPDAGACPRDLEVLSARRDTLQKLELRKRSLMDELADREQEIQKLYDELYILWSKLGVSDEEADAFVEEWAGTQQKCIDAYKRELERMLQVKADNMVIFIAKEREEIAALWDELFYSEADRRRFSLFDTELASEDILADHEAEKLRLVEERGRKAPIMLKLHKYFGLLDEMAQLEASANDPSRLTGKGQRGDPGRLLREEKLRKRVAKEKPKLESDLLAQIPAWEAEHAQLFLVNGTRFVDDLTAKLEFELASRPAAKRGKAPASSALASENAQPLKRQMTGSSSASSTTSSLAAKPSTVKRARTNTLSTASAHVAQAANIQRQMFTGSSVASSSGIYSTPCPAPPVSYAPGSLARGPYGPAAPAAMLTMTHTSQPRMVQQHYNDTNSSRLPLRAQITGFAPSMVMRGSGSTAATTKGLRTRVDYADGPHNGLNSLFSPVAETQQGYALTRTTAKAAFRPRPSVLAGNPPRA